MTSHNSFRFGPLKIVILLALTLAPNSGSPVVAASPDSVGGWLSELMRITVQSDLSFLSVDVRYIPGAESPAPAGEPVRASALDAMYGKKATSGAASSPPPPPPDSHVATLPPPRPTALARVAVLSTEKYSKLSRYVSIRAGEAEMADRSSGSGPSIREVAFTVHTQPRMTFPDHGSQAVSLERLILPLVSVPVVTLRALRVSSLDPDAQTLEACLTVDLDLRGEGAIPLTQVIHDLELNSGGFVIGTRLVSDPDQGPSALETTGKKIGALLGRVNLVLPWERGGSDIDLEPHESLEHWLERKIPGANVQAVGVGHAPLEPSTPKMTHTLGPITGTLTHLIAFADQIRRAPGLRGIGEVRLTPPEPNGTDEAPWILDAEVSLGAP